MPLHFKRLQAQAQAQAGCLRDCTRALHSSSRQHAKSPYLSIAIRREDKSRWERRAPLVPDAVRQLIHETDSKVYVQPSPKRVFTDEQYANAGAIIQEDLRPADVILGIKEVPTKSLLANKTYVYFSHTHKGQLYNMPMLKDALDKRIRLIDYELLTGQNGERVVMFGSYAGYAGMIDTLHGVGQRLLGLGYSTPFLHLGMSHTYKSLASAKIAVRSAGAEIEELKLPKALGPMVIGFLGDGKVSKGAQEILACLPHQWIDAKDLAKVSLAKKFASDRIYAVKVLPQHYIRHNESKHFTSAQEYFKDGKQKYHSVFGSEIAPYLSILINGAYWSDAYPHYMSNVDLKAVQSAGNPFRMMAVGDISCDIRGGLEFFSHHTEIGHPFYYVDATIGQDHTDVEGKGTQIMGVDILPSEIPVDSSVHFSKALYPLVKELVKGNFNHEVLSRATIAEDGKLRPKHDGLKSLLPTHAASSGRHVLLLGSGMVAGPLVDYLLQKGCKITIASNNVSEAAALAAERENTSVVSLDISDKSNMQSLVSEADVVVSFIPAPLHPSVAEVCIDKGVHLVTASYISPAMKALHQRAADRGVLLLNEIGLDPGIDHLSAMKVIDEVTASGNKVNSFLSWCGGLPAPEASDVPLGYKFSWSPRGVLTAALNDARFQMRNEVHSIPGPKLLQSYFKDVPIIRGFNLEGLANRDSIPYADTYGLGTAESMTNMFRGTLRYKGFAEMMLAFIKLGFMDTKPNSKLGNDLSSLLPTLLSSHGKVNDEASQRAAIRDVLGSDDISETLRWLSLLGDKSDIPSLPSKYPKTPLDHFCALLSHKLRYLPGERDMVILHHEFGISNGDFKTSTLVAYGDDKSTAMAKTVGLPAAMAAELILDNPSLTKDLNGVLAPVDPRFYEPLLQTLEHAGVKVVERSAAKSMADTLYW